MHIYYSFIKFDATQLSIMKTRAQKKKEERPYQRRTRVQLKKEANVKGRIFLITEKDGESGWVSTAETPDKAVDLFQAEVTNTTEIFTLKGSVDWNQYMDIEKTMVQTNDRPCYMSKFKLNQKDYYVELLTKPNSSVGWIPTNFS